MREPSSAVKELLNQIIHDFQYDALKCCLQIESSLIQGLTEELRNQEYSFEDKFQIITDLKYVSDYLEDFMNRIQTVLKRGDDPFYAILQFLEED
jgi:hypothetical protein